MQQMKIMLTSALQPVEAEHLYNDYLAAGESIVEWLAAMQDMATMLEIATKLADSMPMESGGS
jgi:hypothetical protein